MPLLLKSKYFENIALISSDLDKVKEEVNVEDKKYLLKVSQLTMVEKYSDTNIVITKGSLRVLFNDQLKIEIFEFVSTSHQEIKESSQNIFYVNEFGITPKFLRSLFITESLCEMERYINEFVSHKEVLDDSVNS